MFEVIKNKGKMVQAYQLGSDSERIRELMAAGRIRDLGGGIYEVFSLETIHGPAGGERAKAGDYIKVDGTGCPYPNDKAFFLANHRPLGGDTYEQIPKKMKAWDSRCEMCREIQFLCEQKGLRIHPDSPAQYYSAPLWGTTETAAKDAVIVFYHISYDANGEVADAEFNFIARTEFERTYSIL